MFHDIIGQEKAKLILNNSLNNRRLAHAYLFHGLEGVGKESVAISFAQALLCNADNVPCHNCRNCMLASKGVHPDWTIVFPQKSASTEKDKQEAITERNNYLKNRLANEQLQPDIKPGMFITIDAVRELIGFLNIQPVESSRKVVIILDADRMNIEAANAFLKTLEEPDDNVIIIMTTSKIEAMLETIISRCQTIPFRMITEIEIIDYIRSKLGLDINRANEIATSARGSIEKALMLSSGLYDELEQLASALVAKWTQSNPAEDFLFAELLSSKIDKSNLKIFLSLLRGRIHDKLINTGSFFWADKIDDLESLEQLIARNVNLRLALAALVFNQPIAAINME